MGTVSFDESHSRPADRFTAISGLLLTKRSESQRGARVPARYLVPDRPDPLPFLGLPPVQKLGDFPIVRLEGV